MVDALEAIFETHPNLIQVAGHEHGLAYTQEDNISFIISGAGAKHTTVKSTMLQILSTHLRDMLCLILMPIMR